MAEVKIKTCAVGDHGGSPSRFDYGAFEHVEVEIEICGYRFLFTGNMDEMEPSDTVMVGLLKLDDEGKVNSEPVWYEEVARKET